MAGVQVYAVDNSPSIISDYMVRLSSGSVNGATQLTNDTNSVTRLGLVFPEEAVILGAWIKSDDIANNTCNLTLVESGSFRALGSGQGGGFAASAAAANGTAMTAAMRSSQTLNLGGLTQNVLAPIPIHPGTAGALNNNVVPPGGEIFVHIEQNPNGLAFVGTLIVRVATKGR